MGEIKITTMTDENMAISQAIGYMLRVMKFNNYKIEKFRNQMRLYRVELALLVVPQVIKYARKVVFYLFLCFWTQTGNKSLN